MIWSLLTQAAASLATSKLFLLVWYFLGDTCPQCELEADDEKRFFWVCCNPQHRSGFRADSDNGGHAVLRENGIPENRRTLYAGDASHVSNE